MIDSNDKRIGTDDSDGPITPRLPTQDFARNAVRPPPQDLNPAPSGSAPPLKDMIAGLSQPIADPRELDRESSFTFPPPSVPAPSSSSSVSPVAMAAEAIVVERKIWRRPSALAIIVAAALTVVVTFGVIAGYSALSARSSAAWEMAWSNAASPAAVTVLGSAADWTAGGALSPATLIDSLPGFVEAESSQSAGQTPEASNETKATASVVLGAILGEAAKTCREDGMVPVIARVIAEFNSWGEVDDVLVEVPPAAYDLGRCLAREARSARIDSFDGARFRVTGDIMVQ